MKQLLLGLAITSTLASVQAKTIYVNSASGSPRAPYGFWATAASDLQTALATATAGDEVWVAAGTYYPDEGAGQTANSRDSRFALIEGVEIYGGFAGTETSLAQRDPATHITILSGDLDQNDGPDFANHSNNAYHVVIASNPGNAVLDGFTITAGNADGPSGDFANFGGGILCRGHIPIIRNCSITGNEADLGGGVANFGNAPIFTNCSFTNNRATGILSGGKGGAIYNGGDALLTNCTFSGNVAADWGGAVCTETGGSTITFVNCSIAGNMAGMEGGGIFNYNAAVVLTNSILWNNAASGVVPDVYYDPFFANNWTYTHSLVQGRNLTGSGVGNLDGTLEANDPRFFLPGNPLSAPFTGANLRLKPGSPAIDKGDGLRGSSANTQAIDIAGKPRFVDGGDAGGTIAAAIIDLGAYEDNPLDPDHDQDGVPDHTEATLASLGFIIGNDDGGRLALLQTNAPDLGLYTPANLQTLAVSQPVISRDPGTGLFQLRTELLRSPDLATPFVPFSAFTATREPESNELLLEFAPPSQDAHFFQIQLGN